MWYELISSALSGGATGGLASLVINACKEKMKTNRIIEDLPNKFMMTISTPFEKLDFMRLTMNTRDIRDKHFPKKKIKKVYKILKKLEKEKSIKIAENNDDYREVRWTTEKTNSTPNRKIEFETQKDLNGVQIIK